MAAAILFLGAACGASGPAWADGLAIQELALTDGQTSWHTKPAWAPGETVFVRVILVGLLRDAEGRIRVRESLELRDPDGKLLLEARDVLKLERQVEDEVSSLELINHLVVPEGLAAGSYRAHVHCDDDVAAASTHGDLELSVGEGSAGGLRITQFSLAPASAASAPDHGVQAEARLVGYRLDARGRYWIEADVVLIDPSGQLALRWDKVLERRERSEPAGLPLKLSLQLELPGRYAPGTYRLELRVRDRLASQEVLQSATWIKR